jgi:hypothetical protein
MVWGIICAIFLKMGFEDSRCSLGLVGKGAWKTDVDRAEKEGYR